MKGYKSEDDATPTSGTSSTTSAAFRPSNALRRSRSRYGRAFALARRCAAAAAASRLARCRPRRAAGAAPVFTPAHADGRRGASAISSAIRPTPAQPIPFPHKTHIDKKAVVHRVLPRERSTKGPVAGLPSVKTCMICHESIATDRPLIQQITATVDKRGVDIPWQRVYGFTHEAHVRFNHAPHIRAKVECATCHGDIAQQTVAERNVDHEHGILRELSSRAKKAPNDCLTCHF